MKNPADSRLAFVLEKHISDVARATQTSIDATVIEKQIIEVDIPRFFKQLEKQPANMCLLP